MCCGYEAAADGALQTSPAAPAAPACASARQADPLAILPLQAAAEGELRLLSCHQLLWQQLLLLSAAADGQFPPHVAAAPAPCAHHLQPQQHTAMAGV
jgi:hypothetical protein